MFARFTQQAHWHCRRHREPRAQLPPLLCRVPFPVSSSAPGTPRLEPPLDPVPDVTLTRCQSPDRNILIRVLLFTRKTTALPAKPLGAISVPINHTSEDLRPNPALTTSDVAVEVEFPSRHRKGTSSYCCASWFQRTLPAGVSLLTQALLLSRPVVLLLLETREGRHVVDVKQARSSRRFRRRAGR